MFEELPVCTALETWAQLGDVLTVEELVVAADHLLTRLLGEPEDTRALLADRIDADRRPAAPRLLAALAQARHPVLSPGETRVGLEYEGGRHTEEEQVLFDVERRETFADHGWATVRVTKYDLRGELRRAALVERVRRRVASRA